MNRERHVTNQLTKHFKLTELMCRCKNERCEHPAGTDEHVIKLAAVLELIRGLVNKPVKVNSGLRCADHNHAVGGSQGSRHLVGLAADVSTKNWTPAEIQLVMKWCDTTGVFYIRYAKHLHIDLRTQVQVALPKGEE